MTKQIQFALLNVYGEENAGFNKALREQLEGVLNNGWELDKWEFVERGLDNNNNRTVTIIVCVTRDKDDEPVGPEPETVADEVVEKKRPGRPAKVEADA